MSRKEFRTSLRVLRSFHRALIRQKRFYRNEQKAGKTIYNGVNLKKKIERCDANKVEILHAIKILDR